MLFGSSTKARLVKSFSNTFSNVRILPLKLSYSIRTLALPPFKAIIFWNLSILPENPQKNQFFGSLSSVSDMFEITKFALPNQILSVANFLFICFFSQTVFPAFKIFPLLHFFVLKMNLFIHLIYLWQQSFFLYRGVSEWFIIWENKQPNEFKVFVSFFLSNYINSFSISRKELKSNLYP